MKRLLVLCHRVPYPPDKGERIRAFHEIRVLSSEFRLSVAALAQDRRDRQAARGLEPWCERVYVARAGGVLGMARGLGALLAGRSATEGYFHSRTLLKALPALAGEGPFDLALGSCSSTLPYLLACPARTRVMDLMDVDSQKWAAYAQAAGPGRAWLYRREAAAVSALERQAVQRCDATLVVSAAEVGALGSVDGQVLAVGNGVDTEYFRPPEPAAKAPRPTLVFTGTMDYRPNVQAVSWFVREVWPPLASRWPDLEFRIVGRDPVPQVRKLADQPGVTVTGSVPDVRPHLASAVAAVCPLRIARGVQNKVLEAMAMGLPVVASPPALTGLDLQVGREVLRADRPDEWQAQIGALLADPGMADSLGRAARRCVVERYGWQARLAPLLDLCRRLTADHTGPQAKAAGAGMPAEPTNLATPGRMAEPFTR